MCHRDEADSRARGQGGLDATGGWAALAAAEPPGPLPPRVPRSVGHHELRPRRDVPAGDSQWEINRDFGGICHFPRASKSCSRAQPELPAVLVRGFRPGAGWRGAGRAPRSAPACPPSCPGVPPCPQAPRAACCVWPRAQARPHRRPGAQSHGPCRPCPRLVVPVPCPAAPSPGDPSSLRQEPRPPAHHRPVALPHSAPSAPGPGAVTGLRADPSRGQVLPPTFPVSSSTPG